MISGARGYLLNHCSTFICMPQPIYSTLRQTDSHAYGIFSLISRGINVPACLDPECLLALIEILDDGFP
jgi:hypothetical protein